jgi:predicted nucleotidyltransferase
MGIDIFGDKLSTFLFSKTRRGLLALLYGRPDETFYINQLMQATGSGSGAVQRELKLMTEAGVLNRTQTGNLVNYQANPQSPIFNELKSIVRKTFGVADVIRQSLATQSDKIRVAFIFGSVARSADDRKSDLDLMVVGKISFGDVVSLISPVEKELGREINPVVYPLPEFKQKVKADHHFVKTVLEGEKIFLIGDAGEISRMVGNLPGKSP